MSKSIVADNAPKKVALKVGEKYYYCTCGKSQNQPFCDGSHKGTDFTPKEFEAKTSEAYLCRCKQTNNAPFCDGTHKSISKDQVGKPHSSKTQQASSLNKAEPHVAYIHQLASEGLSEVGLHGPMTSMGVPRDDLPKWDDIQIMVAQLFRKPLFEYTPVKTELIIGPEARKPLQLKMPLFISDMSFGALSQEVKTALAKGAEMAGTGICSGEGGMLPEEHEQNSRYFYELASAMFGYDESVLSTVQAFHFKGGQAAKTGVGGHLPANKNTKKIAEVRQIPVGTPVVSPPTFKDLHTPRDFKKFADHVRELSGGIPIGFKLSANHIEKDIQFALDASADYIILDGRGGGTGSAPMIFRDHISVPTIPALARARRYLDKQKVSGKVSLIITGGLRVPSDFVKALALGADGIAIANAAIQAAGCIGARMCHTNQCPAGIATQDPELRKKINIDQSAQRVSNYLSAATELMSVMARACGHHSLSDFSLEDLGTWHESIAKLSGVSFTGI